MASKKDPKSKKGLYTPTACLTGCGLLASLSKNLKRAVEETWPEVRYKNGSKHFVRLEGYSRKTRNRKLLNSRSCSETFSKT